MQLLLVFPAWITAFALAQVLCCFSPLVTWRHDVAANNIRQIRMWALTELIADPNLEFSDFDQSQLASDFNGLIDPWGNQYQIIELNQIGLYDSNATFHAYSHGADGKSMTNGNDLDDINSWDYDRRQHYGAMIRNDELRSNLWFTIWSTPIMYLLLAVSLRRFTTARNNAMHAKPGLRGFFNI